MSDIIASSLKTYLLTLTATNTVCTELGTHFTFGTNLFIGIEPETTNCVTIIPYPGGPPTSDGSRQESAIQMRVKADSIRKSLRTSQSIINLLHNNDKMSGKCTAVQSSPIILGVQEGGESVITVSNFVIKHIRL